MSCLKRDRKYSWGLHSPVKLDSLKKKKTYKGTHHAINGTS